jgi:biopolymer transport protein ExbD
MASVAPYDQAPLSEINTTPLIDVLLVLLIMFIITIPIQSHAVKMDLPGKPPPVAIDTVSNKIILTEAGQVQWNGIPVSMPELSRQLATVGAMPKQPDVQLQPEPKARYDLVDEVLVLTKRAQVTRLGFVGNEQYARF